MPTPDPLAPNPSLSFLITTESVEQKKRTKEADGTEGALGALTSWGEPDWSVPPTSPFHPARGRFLMREVPLCFL